MAEVLVTGIKIGDMPLKGTVSGNEKLPTGDVGDLAVTPNQIKNFTIQEGNLVNQEQLDDAIESVEQTASGLAGRVQTLEDRTSNVDNTSDLDKPISNATQAALDTKADKNNVVTSVNGSKGDVVITQGDLINLGTSFVSTSPQFTKIPEIVDVNNVAIPELNTQAKALGNSIDVYRSGLLARYDSEFSEKIGGYPLNARIMLSNGDIVKNTTPNNTANPNIDTTAWVKDNAASQIFDKSGVSQQKINDDARINNVKNFGAVGTTALVSDWYTVGTTNYRGYANLAAVKVDYPFIIDGTESIDYAGFQATVNFAIANGSNRIFIPFDNSEKYFLNRTVKILSSGFFIDGNRTPSYHIHLRGGYIYAPSNVTDLFDYGNGGVYDSNQLVINGVAGLGLGDVPRTQNFVKMNQNNNGPHRGVLVENTSARGFYDAIAIAPTNPSFIGAATVIIGKGCCFTSNQNTVSSTARVFGFSMFGAQSEAGARISGKFDGGVSFRDNMLEGQSNPIDIDSNQPSLILENNYFESITGDYISRLRGTNVNTIFDERPNYISSVSSTDIHRLRGVVRLHAPYRYHLRNDRISLYSLIGANLAFGSKFDGAAYVGTTNSTDGAAGFCDPLALNSARSTAKFNKFVGSDVLDTPLGKTYSGLKSSGTSAYITINAAGWAVGDVVTAVALVKIPSGEAINMSVYASTGELIGSVAQNTMNRMAEGWHIVFISLAASVASTTTRFRFTSTQQIEVAAVGVDVTPVSDFKTFNSVQRAEVQIFNPLPLNAETYTYRDVRTINIPAIAAGGEYTTTSISVFGASVGDVVVCSPNVAMQGLDWFARVSAANTVELRIVNRTAASITLGSVQWNTRVFK